jgi:hypothetical protein
MSTDKPFDETRSAAIEQMLMAEVARSADPRRAARRRGGLIAALAAVALVLAGGSAAVAFNAGGIFRPVEVAPTTPSPIPPSPRPTPSATRVPVAPPASTPNSTIPLSCQDLSAAGALSLSAPSLSSGSGPTGDLYRVADTGPMQAGVLHCQWNDSGEGGFVALTATADSAGGASQVASALSDGWMSLGVGAASAWSCDKRAPGCTAIVVDGAYWMELTTQVVGLTADTGKAALAGTAQALVAQLRAHPDPVPAWQHPVTVWDGADCSAWAGAAVGTIVGTPGLSGPTPIAYGATSALNAVGGTIGCRWSVPDQTPASPEQHRSIDVELVPGSAWAWDRRDLLSADVEPMTVAGADAADLVCTSSEGSELCWLDVLADGSWMRVSESGAAITGDRVRFVAVAEAVLALR